MGKKLAGRTEGMLLIYRRIALTRKILRSHWVRSGVFHGVNLGTRSVPAGSMRNLLEALRIEGPSRRQMLCTLRVTVTHRSTFFEKPTTMSKVVFGPSCLSTSQHSPSPASAHISRQSGMSRTTWARHVLLQIKPQKQPPFLTAVAQDQLIDVFKSVGQVVGFRCVSDQCTSPLCRRSLTHLSSTQARV